MKTPAKRASIPLGRGWSIALRRDEVVPHDPGQGTPAMVCGPFGVSSTYWYASDTGEAYGSHGDVDIPASVMRRLHAAESEVQAYLSSVEAWLAGRAS